MYLLRLCIHSFFLVIVNISWAADYEKITSNVNTQLLPGSELTVYDNILFSETGRQLTLPSYKKPHLLDSSGILLLEVMPYGEIPLTERISVNVRLLVDSKHANHDGSLSETSETVELNVDYDPKPGNNYVTQNLWKIDNSQYLFATVETFSIIDSRSGADLTSDPEMLKRVKLSGIIKEDLVHSVDIVESPSVGAPNIDDENGVINIRWGPLEWAERYELEWTYINDYDHHSLTLEKPPDALEYDFKSNSTRITTEILDPRDWLEKGFITYQIPVVFDRGYLLYRVRGVGRSKNNEPVAGDWSGFRDDSGTGFDPYTGDEDRVVRVPAHDETKPWRRETAYAESRLRKDVVSYFDGSLRSRQAVTQLHSPTTSDLSNPLIVAESIYDYQGRAIVNVLPSPLSIDESPAIHYQNDFTVNTRGEPYTFRDAEITDYAATECALKSADPLRIFEGAGNYFSVKNPNKVGHQGYVPDAAGYPFSHTAYYPDDTNRVIAQGLPGVTHQLGNGHASRYYYGEPSQDELDRIFGHEAGIAKHYTKQLIVGPDGQASVSYRNPSGKIVASALVGDPENQSLVPIEGGILKRNKKGLLSNRRNETQLTSVSTLLISEPGIRPVINYSFTPPDVNDDFCAHADPELCFDCAYDLEIDIVDLCGNTLFEKSIEIGSLESLGTCSADPESVSISIPSDDHLSEILLSGLPVGSYTVKKTLTVNEEKLEAYLDHYMQESACVPTPGLLGPAVQTCVEECIQCEIETINVPTTAKIINPDGSEGEIPVSVPVEQRNESASNCQRNCNLPPEKVMCEVGYQSLLADMRPGSGQYAGYSYADDGTLVIPELSILDETNGLPYSNASWRNPVTGYIASESVGRYLEENGQVSLIAIPEGDESFCLSDVAGDGRCFPHELSNVNDFIANWKPSWAAALAPYHPEYGYYRWCKQFESITSGNPFVYEEELKSFETHNEAFDNGLLPESGIIENDPLNDVTRLASELRNKLHAAYTIEIEEVVELAGGGRYPILVPYALSLKEFVHAIISCNNPNFTSEETVSCAESMGEIGQTPGVEDDEWRMYRDIYLSLRKQVIFQDRTNYVSRAGDGFYLNTCIGVEAPRDCNGPINARYAEKAKRFVDDKDALELLPDDDLELVKKYLDGEGYKHCGTCPLATDFQALLFMAANRGKLTESFTVPAPLLVPSRELLDTFPSPYERSYEWAGSGERNEIDINISTAGRTQCDIRLSAGEFVKLGRLKFLSCLKAAKSPPPEERVAGIEPSSYFSAQGILSDGSVTPITGYASCIDFRTCDIPKTCESNNTAAKLADLLAYAIDNRMLNSETTAGQVKLDVAIFDEAIPSVNASGARILLPAGHSWWWDFQEFTSPSKRSFRVSLSTGIIAGEFLSTRCTLNFRILSLEHSFLSDLTIIGAAEIYEPGADDDPDACSVNRFIIKAEDQRGRIIDIEVTSTCHEVGSCCLPEACEVQPGGRENWGIVSELIDDVVQTDSNIDWLFANSYSQPYFSPNILVEIDLDNEPRRSDNTNLKTCNNCCYTPTPPFMPPNTCEDRNQREWDRDTEQRTENNRQRLRERVRQAYLDRCLSTSETFYATLDEKIHHYTLFYYDVAGNLIKTVPPKGVDVLDETEVTLYERARESGGDLPPVDASGNVVVPNHKMSSTYRYNSFNAITQTNNPDSGIAQQWYDSLGRPIVSQTAYQADTSEDHGGRLYSFIHYDELGRVTSSGEVLTNSEAPSDPEFWDDEIRVNDWLSAGEIRDVVRTGYDRPQAESLTASRFDGGQQNLRNRISATHRTTNNDDDTLWQQANFFSYDTHGNAHRMLSYFENMPEAHKFKTIDYQYDLISGNLNKRIYQLDQADQFIHKYEYDADNRLKSVNTSTNGITWDKDAGYEYYDHGPLARIELGQENVQGIDYAYTITGALKGVNADTLNSQRDIGKDGLNIASNPEKTTPPDTFGYSLNYYNNDYLPITNLTPENLFYGETVSGLLEQNSLYDGNIRSVIAANPGLKPDYQIVAEQYRYDSLRRLRDSQTVIGHDETSNSWNSAGLKNDFATSYEYDANGNFETISRKDKDGEFIDDLVYAYNDDNNQLNHISDAIGVIEKDIGNQSTDNYTYDANGRVTTDLAGGVSDIEWTATEKLKEVKDANGTTSFWYDANDRRTMKLANGIKEWTIRDASGQILAVYRQKDDVANWVYSPIYGHDRLGVYAPSKQSSPSSQIRGDKYYELSNQVGSVSSLVIDRKSPSEGESIYQADILSAQQYYPFGMVKDQGVDVASGYRFGFQGMERNPSLFNSHETYTTEFRQYDARVGRWLGVDPEQFKYPDFSVYSAYFNNPITYTDESGADPAEEELRSLEQAVFDGADEYWDANNDRQRTRAARKLYKLDDNSDDRGSYDEYRQSLADDENLQDAMLDRFLETDSEDPLLGLEVELAVERIPRPPPVVNYVPTINIQGDPTNYGPEIAIEGSPPRTNSPKLRNMFIRSLLGAATRGVPVGTTDPFEDCNLGGCARQMSNIRGYIRQARMDMSRIEDGVPLGPIFNGVRDSRPGYRRARNETERLRARYPDEFDRFTRNNGHRALMPWFRNLYSREIRRRFGNHSRVNGDPYSR